MASSLCGYRLTDVGMVCYFAFSIDLKLISIILPKLYHPQAPANENTLSNDPSANLTCHLLALNLPVPQPPFLD